MKTRFCTVRNLLQLFFFFLDNRADNFYESQELGELWKKILPAHVIYSSIRFYKESDFHLVGNRKEKNCSETHVFCEQLKWLRRNSIIKKILILKKNNRWVFFFQKCFISSIYSFIRKKLCNNKQFYLFQWTTENRFFLFLKISNSFK